MRPAITGAIVATVAAILAVPLTSADVGAAGSGVASVSVAPTWFTEIGGSTPELIVSSEDWSLLTNATVNNSGDWQQTFDDYFTLRQAQGYNAVEVTIFSYPDPSALVSSGQDSDGVWPFSGSSNNPSNAFNSAWTARRDAFFSTAASYGFRVFVNITTPYLSIGAFTSSWTNTQWTDWGTKIGTQWGSVPNVMWMVGDDYFNEKDAQLDLLLTAMRAHGATQPISIQNHQEMGSRQDFYTGGTKAWGTANAQFNWGYTYQASYDGVEKMGLESPSIPYMWGDGFFLGTGTRGITDKALMRRMVWWALSSGSKGVQIGNNNVYPWDTPAALTEVQTNTFYTDQVPAIATYFRGLSNWHQLKADTSSLLVTAGRGTHASPLVSGGSGGQLLDNSDSYVSASYIQSGPDAGTLAVIYMSHASTITIDEAQMVEGYTATWVDPADGSTSAATPGTTYNSGSKGTNSVGDVDWVLVLEESTESDNQPPDTSITGGPAEGSTTNENAPTFGFTASEEGSTFQCRLDAAAFAACTTPFTSATLSDGAHSFAVRAIDPAGNIDPTPATRSFTVDTTPPDNQPPDTSITGGPAEGSTTNENAPTFGFTASEEGSTFQCRLDAAAFAACTTPFTSATLADGVHSFAVRAIDPAGNIDPTPATRSFTVDTTPPDNQPPDTSITGGPAEGSTTNENAPTFGFTASEEGSTFQCRLDAAAFAACTTPFTSATLADGVHRFAVRAIDPAGNIDPTPATRSFTVDTTPPDNQPPDTSITGGPAEGSTTNENAPTFGFTASEEGSTFQCRLDAAAFAACTTPFTSATLADGVHRFAVRAIDPAGNIDPTPATRSFTVDTTPPDNQPPDTSITGGPAEGSTTNENAPTFGFTASEEGSTFQCRLDAAAFAACTTPFTSATLADGVHRFAVRAIDPAGNIDPTPATRSFTVDTTPPDNQPPDTSITGGPAEGSTTNENAPTFGFTASEEGSTFQCRLDAAAFAACTTPFTSATLADGAHSFAVRAIDPAGNIDPTPATRSFTVDTTPPDNQPPDTSITGGPAEGSTTNENAPTFGFTASEEGSTFQCRLDAAAFAACTTPFTSATLADGVHRFAVRAIDPAGNIDPTPATRSFTVDTTPPDNQPPDTSITGGPAEGSTTNENAPTFGFTASEEGSTFQCRVDAAAFAACTTPFTSATLADGAHRFAVRAIDPAGNIDPTPATRSFTVDTTPPDNQPPDTSITGGPAEGSTTNENAPTFGFTASEEGSTFQCRLDAAAFAACTTPFTSATLSDGAHSFAVRAIDPAGNIDPTPATRSFTVDTTPPDNQPPDTSITGGPAEGSTTNENAPTFGFTASEEGSTFQCRLDAAAFAACTTPFTTSATLADGEHSFAVRAIDGAGNTDPTPATATFTVSAAATCDGKAATIVGTPGDDSLVGTTGVDVIVGLGGDDTLTSGAGNDIICGNAGNDLIWAGGGNDTVDGGDGNDILAGAGGDDALAGNGGDDILAGSGGDDHLDGGPGRDFGLGGGGTNVVINCEGWWPWPVGGAQHVVEVPTAGRLFDR